MIIDEVKVELTMDLSYVHPSKDQREQFMRNHQQNMINRVAFNYFRNGTAMEDLKNHIATELLLEGESIPSSIKFRT